MLPRHGYRERAWSGVGRRGDSLGGSHGVFVFPYPDHCCGPGCHELSQERSQRSSMPKYVPKPRAWVVHRLWLFKSADPQSGQPSRLQNGWSQFWSTLPAALRTLTSSNSGLLITRPSPKLLWLAHGKPVRCIRTAAGQLLDLDGHFHLNWVHLS